MIVPVIWNDGCGALTTYSAALRVRRIDIDTHPETGRPQLSRCARISTLRPSQFPAGSTTTERAMASSLSKRAKEVAEALKEVDEVFQELSSRDRVRGVIATTTEGATIKSTLEDDEATAKYAQLAAKLCAEVRNAARDAGGNDEPQYFQVKTRRQEIVIAPSKKYNLVMIADVPPQGDQ